MILQVRQSIFLERYIARNYEKRALNSGKPNSHFNLFDYPLLCQSVEEARI
jgi:hypothetical protein